MMNILSLEFAGLVLGTVIIYHIVPLKIRWLILLLSSCVFYAFSGWQGCLWLFLTAALTFSSSLLQQRLRTKELELSDMEDKEAFPDQEEEAKRPGSSKKIKKLRKILLAATLIIPLFAMALAKYYFSVREWITTLPALSIIVPLGLSYFTFQCAGYTIDIYRGKYPAEKNPLKYLLFASFFPQMTQGPISSYPQLAPQLFEGHRFSPENFVMGGQLLLWGLMKKMVLADNLARVTEGISDKQSGWMILLTVIAYAVRLYADFSGGMDIIRGTAKMLGIDMVQNFRRPFFSFSVAEYWRRWHITLGAWFRSYLFYPLTTSGFGLKLSKLGRKLFGKKTGRALPAAVATVIIFFLIGIWHTLSANAVIFGLYFGFLLGTAVLLDNVFKKLKKKLKINDKSISWKVFCLARTLILIILPQYFAFTDSPKTAIKLLRKTFTEWNFKNAGKQFSDVTYPILWYIAACAFVVMLIVDIICEKKPELNRMLAAGPFYIRWTFMLVLLLGVLIFGAYGADYDATAFLYTNF